MTEAMQATDRAVLGIGGADAGAFLQGLVTNDVARVGPEALYAAILTPQGKYLFDFFLVPDPEPKGGRILLDVQADRAAALAQRLAMYRLRAQVSVEPLALPVAVGLGAPPAGAFADPRDPALGWRAYGETAAALLAGAARLDPAAFTALRIAHGVPATGIELIADASYILEMGFERLHGVDFRKGCYVGQEVTARMKHKTELKKGLARVEVAGAAAPGTEITAAGKSAGVLYSVQDGQGLAYLRFDRAEGPMRAGAAELRRIG